MGSRLAAILAMVLCAVSTAAMAAAPVHWVGSWATSVQIPEPGNALAPEDLKDATLRQIVHLSLGGTTIRVRISNTFGTQPLHLTGVHVARAMSPAKSAIDPATDTALTFSGAADVTIPAGADYLSDPVAFAAPALSDVAITLHLSDPPQQQTGHPGSRATSYYTHGDRLSALELADAKTIDHWYFIEGVDVAAPPDAASIAVLGDSITDGHGATTNGNDRWTDVLAMRLQAGVATKDVGVLNEGIGGNHLLHDGLGPSALARFDRDILAPAGVKWLIVLEGVNDLGGLAREAPANFADHDALVHQIIGAFRQIAARAHARGVKVYGATILPFADSTYYHPDASTEADRQAIDAWMRTSPDFDAVIDLDQVTRDPARPERMRADVDSGDHLHPGPAGYRAMGEAVPLSLFEDVRPAASKAPAKPKRHRKK